MAKLDPDDLYDLDPDRPDVDGAVLLQALDGFVDAGSTGRIEAPTVANNEENWLARSAHGRNHRDCTGAPGSGRLASTTPADS